jgi:outer membrane receptor protein involved in Fe transport
MRYRFRSSIGIAVFLLLLAAVALGQTTGTIEGNVTDQNGGALPGVTITISSPNLQGTRSATTDNQGFFRFVSLPPGSYRVVSDLSGFGSLSKVAAVRLDATATVNFQMALAAAEQVMVTGEAPIVDVTSTTTGTSYTAKVMERMPLGRNYADIVKSQPGVQEDTGETQGRSLALSIYGSTSAENLFLIDGVNTTNVIKGFQGKIINPEFIQEVEVKTGGYQAEYGRNTGGVINVITKSGGNEFHGDVFGYYNNTDMRADEDIEITEDYSERGDVEGSSTLPKEDRAEYGADLGGFFVKDHLWFFGAYSRIDEDREVRPTSGPVAGQDFPLTLTTDVYAGKLTANLFQSTTLVATLFADPQDNEGALFVPISTNPNTYNATRELGGTDYAFRLNQLFGSFGILTAQYGFHEERYLLTPQGVNEVRVTDATISPNVAFGGFGSVFGPTNNNQSERDQYGATFTAYFGNHEFKLGGDIQDDVTFGETYRTGGQGLTVRACTQAGSNRCDLSLAPSYVNARGTTVPAFFQHTYYVVNPGDLTPIPRAPFDTPTERWGAFIQDTWRVNPRFTINAGVRYDEEEIIRSDGVTAFTLEEQWAPRFGFTWDFVGDGSSKLYGSAGRFYYALPTDLNVRVFSANTQVVTFNYSPTDLAQHPLAPPGRSRLIQGGSAEGEPVDPGVEAAYQDEYTIGVEKALDPTFSVGLKGTYRDLGNTVEDRCDLDYNDPLSHGSTCALFNPGGDGPAASGEIQTCNHSSNPTDPTVGDCGPGVPVGEAKREFIGVELVARKAFSDRFWAQASYLWSRLEGNYSGAIRVASGQTDPGINADYDYNEFLINADGKLELDRPHQFRLDTVYTAPFGLTAGLRTYIRSGTPTSKQGFYNQFYPSELFLTERGSEDRNEVEYEADLSFGYNINVGPVTITPQLYIYNLLNAQRVTAVDEEFNPRGSFVTNTSSPFFGQAGVEPGTAGPDGRVCNEPVPCTDNPDYRKATSVPPGRTDPRLIRAALKITF